MNDILYVIKYCGRLVSTTYLSFGAYHFSILNIMVSMASIVIVGWFLRKVFSD